MSVILYERWHVTYRSASFTTERITAANATTGIEEKPFGIQEVALLRVLSILFDLYANLQT